MILPTADRILVVMEKSLDLAILVATKATEAEMQSFLDRYNKRMDRLDALMDRAVGGFTSLAGRHEDGKDKAE